MGTILLLPPFYRRGNRRSEKKKSFLEPHSVNSSARIWTQLILENIIPVSKDLMKDISLLGKK